MTPTGFPHSEISGSTLACNSPELIAANHVLHRLLTPRHSPCARSSLVTNLSPPRGPFDPRSLAVPEDLAVSPFGTMLVHRYFLYRDTPSTRSSRSMKRTTRSPLTLDCFVRACDSNDVLKTRFRVVVFYWIFREPNRVRQGSRRRGRILSELATYVKSLARAIRRWSVRGSNP